MRIYLDTNVVCDSMFDRAPWNADAHRILRTIKSGQNIGFFSTLSVANLFYLGRRIVGSQRALGVVQTCLSHFEITAIDRNTLESAWQMPGSDFEDNIQLAAAVAAVVDSIVTRDPRGFVNSSIPVLSPPALLQQLNIP